MLDHLFDHLREGRPAGRRHRGGARRDVRPAQASARATAPYSEFVLVVTRYRVDEPDQAAFRDEAFAALEALICRPGCTGGYLGRAVDEPALWTLTTTWESVGAYRRALSDFAVKLVAVPLMYRAINESTAFEQILSWTPAQGLAEHDSGLARGADDAVRPRRER